MRTRRAPFKVLVGVLLLLGAILLVWQSMDMDARAQIGEWQWQRWNIKNYRLDIRYESNRTRPQECTVVIRNGALDENVTPCAELKGMPFGKTVPGLFSLFQDVRRRKYGGGPVRADFDLIYGYPKLVATDMFGMQDSIRITHFESLP